jgi:hypothetical protein|tara:strand:- start:1451 stop:1771 length:321 start_codon:yes stop_codon:yes gene_type:complete
MSMEITKNQIVDVINLMMTRLDSLENEQTKQKEYIAQIKKRMLELNDFINDVIDIVEDENYSDSESIEKTMEIYSQMKAKLNKLISDSELENMDVKQLMSQIIGES